MSVQRLVLLCFLAALIIACLAVAVDCNATGPCGLMLAQASSWPQLVFGSILLLGLWAGAGWGLKLGLTIVQVTRDLGRLSRVPIPHDLEVTASAAHIQRIACIQAGLPTAFCAGFLRPTVFISDSTVAMLSDDELAAVLHHEADHARRFEPLRRVAREAAADVLPFLPIVKWWSERCMERGEIEADLVAEHVVGRSALAGALLVMSAPASALAAFTGQTELRARRLIGAEIEKPRPPRAVWVATLTYGWLAISVAGCLFEALAALT